MTQHDLPATRWAHACVLAIERALGRPFSGEDAARVQRALLNDTAVPPSTDDAATLRAERDALAKENDTLRGLLGNSAKPCTYCGLAAEDQAKCASGFPGCSRADDQMLSKHFADGYAAEQARAEVERLREALEHLIERADTSDDCQYGTLSTAYVRDIARAALESKP